MLKKTPIVVILGSTAVGKTKLSIELARKFNGEIISADSMQIYKGLDISTAKATAAERSQAPHHMLDVCDVRSKMFSVVDYRNAAMPIIDKLISNNQMPIIVGGTNYYIESLLWKVLVSSQVLPQFEVGLPQEESIDNRISSDEILRILSPGDCGSTDPSLFHKLLSKVDPLSGQRIHPNDSRKVLRALQVYVTAGETMTDVLEKQQKESGGSYLGGPLRYDNVVMLFLKTEQQKLDQRIDRRIDSMVSQGLLYEVRECYKIMRNDLVASGQSPDELDCTLGMTQAIGFKEFFPYLQKYEDESLDRALTEHATKKSGPKPEGYDLLMECLEELRLRTKRYSKKQLKWTKNRLIQNKGRAVPPIFELDATNAETQWNEDVYLKADDVIQSYIDGREPQLSPVEHSEHPAAGLDQTVAFFCDSCQRRFVGEFQWNEHLQGQRHRSVLQKQKKQKNQKSSLVRSISNYRVIGAILRYSNSIIRRIRNMFR